MNNSNVAKFFSSARTAVVKHSPEILTGIGIAGMITSTVLAVKATPKALASIEAKKEEKQVDKLPPMEIVKSCWKCYAPAAISASLSIACLIGANSVNARRNAALATAYTLSDTALREYQKKVVETVGETKDKAIKDAIAKDQVEKTPVTNNEVIITDNGDTLCLDVMSQRYFKTSREKIKEAENEINRRMLRETYVSLNDFYYELGLKGTEIGYDIGWNVNDDFLETYISAQLADDGTPCMVLNYRVAPRHDYQDR